MCLPYGQTTTITFPNGVSADVHIELQDAPDATDSQFFVELNYPLNTPLWRICLEDEKRAWRTYLYSDGPWLVDRGDGASWQQGVAIPQPDGNGNQFVTTSAIALITVDPDEWAGYCSDHKSYGITVYFTMPLGGGGDFILDEPEPSIDAFPLRFALPAGVDEQPGNPLKKKKIIIIWR